MKRVSQNAPVILTSGFAAVAIILLALTLGLRNSDLTRIESVLCTFKHDLEARSANTQAFINDLRSGRRHPIPGITISDLERSRDAQQSTLNSLSDLKCGKESP